MPEDSPQVHWNLPDTVDGAWAERRRLAAAIRVLSERCVTTDASVEELAHAADSVESLVTRLKPGPTSRDHFLRGTFADTAVELIDRTALMGRSNPWAPPMRVVVEGAEVRCELAFAEVHVGAPGMVHGGVLSAVMDQLFGYALVMSHRRGFTGRLTIRYLRPTPLQRAVRCRAWLGEVSGRRVMVHGDLQLEGEVLVEAEALMIQMDSEQAQQVIRNA